MYTYIQWPVCKKENMAMYVYIRAGSRTPTRAYVRPGLVYTAGWERRNNVVVVFIGKAWTEQAMETRPGVPQNGGNGLVFDRPCSKWDPVHREGFGYRKTEETDLCWTSYGRNGVMLIGRGVAYRKTEETDLLRSKRGSC